MVDLQGEIVGGSSGYYDAGGTLVPYLAGSVEIQAQRLAASGTLSDQFAALNQRRRSTQERHQFNVTLRGEPVAGWRVLLDANYSQSDSNSRGRNFTRPIDGATTAAAFTAAMAAGRASK